MLGKKACGIVFFVFLLSFNIHGAEDADSASTDRAADLHKQVEDPLSGLILLPMLYNYASSVGPLDKPAHVMYIEPNFPIDINENWKIITHTVIPFVSLPVIGTDETSSGLSNIVFSALVAKKSQRKFTLGIGSGLVFPTASDTAPLSWTNTPTGYDCWAAGPAVVGVFKSGPWIAGALLNQMWSFGGDETTLNTMQIYGFVFYNLPKAYAIGYEPLINIDWSKPADQSTLLPIGLQAGKLFMIGGVFPFGVSVGGYYNVIRPDFAPKSTFRAEFYTILPEFW